MAKKIYQDVDLKKNELKQSVIHNVTSFPADAREGQIIYHTTLNQAFVCINDTIDTTLKGAWGLQVESTDLIHSGDPDKVLVSNASGGFDLDNVDGGTY